MIVKIVVPDSIYANVYFARGEQGPQGVTGNTGPQGPSGIVNVVSPITNSGTTTAANIGLNQALIQIAPAQVTGTAVVTADSRLSDQRVPTDGSVTDTKIVAGGLSPNRVTGTAVITTDSRLSDARTPTAHAASHGSAGSDPVTLAQSQITNLVSDLTAKAPIDSPVFTTKVSLPVTSGTFLGTNSLGEIYKVGSAPGLGYLPYTASVGGGIAWQNLATLVKTDSANTFTVGGHIVANSVAGTIPWIIKGAASQSADLQQWQNTSSTVLSRIDQNGSISVPFLGSTTASRSYLQTNGDTGSLQIFAGSAALKALTVRGAASQSANLQEWQNSAGSILTRIASGGGIFTGQNSGFGGRVTVGSETVQGAARLVALATSATDVPFVSRGFASQSANLQEWQNDAGTVLAKVGNTGDVTAPAFRTTLDYIVAGQLNSGGSLRIERSTAAGTGTTNQVRLQVLTGTTGLKIVAVGPTGTVVTIADNIT